jgi:hypothetical protein
MTERTRIRVGIDEFELVCDRQAAADVRAFVAAHDASGEAALKPPASVEAKAGAGRAKLFWTSVAAAIGYYVLRPDDTSGARYPQDSHDQATGLSYIDADLLPGTYHYAVVSESAEHDISDPSEIVSVSIASVSAPEPTWRPDPLDPLYTFDWQPRIGAPAWGELDVAEVVLRSNFDVHGAGLRRFVIASLDDAVPYESGLTQAVEQLRNHGGHRPFVGLSLGSTYEVMSEPAVVSELGGLAHDLGHYGIGLAIRFDR